MTPGRLAILSLVLALGAIAGYATLLRVVVVRNHPELYVIVLAIAALIALVALVRARRWYTWVTMGVTALLFVFGAWFNFVGARVPDTPTALRVGSPPPDLTLSDASGARVSLADYRGVKPIIVVFYRGYW